MSDTKTPTSKLEFEDHPEGDYITIEGMNFDYDFFKKLSMGGGVPMGGLLRIESRQLDKTPNRVKNYSVNISLLMTAEQSKQHQKRIITPVLTFPKGGGN